MQLRIQTQCDTSRRLQTEQAEERTAATRTLFSQSALLFHRSRLIFSCCPSVAALLSVCRRDREKSVGGEEEEEVEITMRRHFLSWFAVIAWLLQSSGVCVEMKLLLSSQQRAQKEQLG
ncbi:hypothetical protein KOW79_010729 [Hemibagrus wyckioides]|uniref:Uncharacterized protein n=1 Tax=Hemibagrus wyckioides TaxID=337641 RepID=A0A9D3SNH7_9TELE|nr:hypothetical protein KOW79_010729 [Hemibagrus wyckioides]